MRVCAHWRLLASMHPLSCHDYCCHTPRVQVLVVCGREGGAISGTWMQWHLGGSSSVCGARVRGRVLGRMGVHERVSLPMPLLYHLEFYCYHILWLVLALIYCGITACLIICMCASPPPTRVPNFGCIGQRLSTEIRVNMLHIKAAQRNVLDLWINSKPQTQSHN